MLTFFRTRGEHRRRRKAAFAPWERQQPVTGPMQRAYLEDATYLLPKDGQEDERLTFQHHALHHAFGNHYLAPLSPDTRTMLDVGCGTGIWSTDMARLFPQAHILGVDLALTSLPTPPPAACLFAQADVLQPLPFPAQQFDFVHQRLLVFAIPAQRWPQVVQELVRVTRVQGWVELLEGSMIVQNGGPATARLCDWLRAMAQAQGIDLDLMTHLGELLRAAGCQTVEAQDIPVPLGAWAGRAGEMLKVDALRAFQALQPRSALQPDAFDAMLNAVAKEWEQRRVSVIFHAAYGRREQA